MKSRDYFVYAKLQLGSQISRYLLLVFAIAIGVSAILLLIGVGQSIKYYVNDEFTQLGSRLIAVLPGKKETAGGAPPITGLTSRDLTIEDANAISALPFVELMAPVIAGTSLVKVGSLSREAITLGSNDKFLAARNISLAYGRNLSEKTSKQATSEVILGGRIANALFPSQSPVGKRINIANYKFRVVGVIKDQGQSLGVALGDMIIIPVINAQQIFNTQALFRVLITHETQANANKLKAQIIQLVKSRHHGDEDITIITQDSIVGGVNQILDMLTAVVSAIAAISLIIAGVLILNITLVSVSQRQSEIGLLKALGAQNVDVRNIFLAEMLLISMFSIFTAHLFSWSVVALVTHLYPELPFVIPYWASALAICLTLFLTAIFTWFPAKKAATLSPIAALTNRVKAD